MTAAATALAEARSLADLSERWRLDSWGDLAPREADVVGLHDPGDDLARRGRAWGYTFDRGDLSDLLRFASGLALAESEAWKADDPTVATKAYEHRRFLIGDRMIHWAVPWLDAVGRCHPDYRQVAHGDRDALLVMADMLRLAPALTGDEGLFQPGEDSYGPMVIPDLTACVASVWGGLVVLDATVLSLTTGTADRSGLAVVLDDPERRGDLGFVYEAAAARWRSLAGNHPGTARLWLHLARRADVTALALSA